MQRLQSTMTADQLRQWIAARGLNTYTAPSVLGISRRQLHNYLSGAQPIPQTIELLTEALNSTSPHSPDATAIRQTPSRPE